jgi:acyl-coenzyme A thioesterase 13
MTGVSTDISTTFVKPAGMEGDILHCIGTVDGMGECLDFYEPSKVVYVRIGKTLAFTKVEFINPAGQLVAFGRKSPGL